MSRRRGNLSGFPKQCHELSEFSAESLPEREGCAVKKKRFSVEQIVAVLKQAEAGTQVAELSPACRNSEQTFYRWKKQYAGLRTDQVRQLKLLQEENARLKKLVAQLTLDKAMLTDVLQKSGEAPHRSIGSLIISRQVTGSASAGPAAW
jgi:putative transposase